AAMTCLHGCGWGGWKSPHSDGGGAPTVERDCPPPRCEGAAQDPPRKTTLDPAASCKPLYSPLSTPGPGAASGFPSTAPIMLTRASINKLSSLEKQRKNARNNAR